MAKLVYFFEKMQACLKNLFYILSFQSAVTTSLEEKTNDPKFVVFTDIFFQDIDFHEATSNFARFRDYHREKTSTNPWYFRSYPRIILINILAQASNATLTSGNQAAKSAKRHPEVRVISTYAWSSFTDYRNQTYNLIDKIPKGVQLVPVEADGWLFLYSDVPRTAKVSILEFSIFLDPFDRQTWILLLTSLLLVALLSGKCAGVIMSIVSATFLIGTKEPSRRCKLFIAWMVTCMVLGNLYSGEITSKIMVPPKDDVMTEFEQLRERNYSALYPTNFMSVVNNTLEYVQNLRSKQGMIIKWLVKHAVAIDMGKLVEALILDERKLVIPGPWSHIHMLAWYSKAFLKTLNGKSGERKCHVGQELAQMAELFFVFLPPKNSELVRAFQWLIQAGIYQRWDVEKNGIMHSNRVQDRVRVKSPTKVVEMEANVMKSQGLKGKMVTMFLLWGVCIFISLVGYSLELVFMKTSHMPLITQLKR